MRRLDGDLLNIEVYRCSSSLSFKFIAMLSKLPKLFRKQPIAKTGVKNFSVNATADLSALIEYTFSDSLVAKREILVGEKFKIGLLIYMYVMPSHRGNHLGDFLLAEVEREFKERGDDFILIVHDDNGSGKLIQYYLDRGFKSIESFLPNGLIKQLET